MDLHADHHFPVAGRAFDQLGFSRGRCIHGRRTLVLFGLRLRASAAHRKSCPRIAFGTDRGRQASVSYRIWRIAHRRLQPVALRQRPAEEISLTLQAKNAEGGNHESRHFDLCCRRVAVRDREPARRTGLSGRRQYLARNVAGRFILQVVLHRQERAQTGPDHGSFLGRASDLHRCRPGLAVLHQERHDRPVRGLHAEMAGGGKILPDAHLGRHALGAGRLHRHAGIVRRRDPHPRGDRFQGRQDRALGRLLGQPLVRRRDRGEDAHAGGQVPDQFRL